MAVFLYNLERSLELMNTADYVRYYSWFQLAFGDYEKATGPFDTWYKRDPFEDSRVIDLIGAGGYPQYNAVSFASFNSQKSHFRSLICPDRLILCFGIFFSWLHLVNQ